MIMQNLQVPLLDKQRMESALQACFPDDSQKKINIVNLGGGYSEATSFHILYGDKSYVLRLQDLAYSSIDLQSELYAARIAAAENLSPKIYWAAADASIFLMEYIKGKTITLEQSRELKNIRKLAGILHKVHALPERFIGREPFFNRTLKFYEKLRKTQQTTNDTDKAISKAIEIHEKLQSYHFPQTMIHGDLHPNNIFLDGDSVKLIDWAETNYDDSFYDLSCLSLMHGYTEQEKTILLEAYCDSMVTDEKYFHYKMLEFLNLVNFFTIVINMDRIIPKKKILLHEWSWYVERFAERHEKVSEQFFYEWGRCALEKVISMNSYEV